MEFFEKQCVGDVVIEKLKLNRATILEAGTIKARLLENINLKQKKIILDITECTFIDSTFFGALVFSLKKIREIGGDIKLVTAPSYTNSVGIIDLSNVRNLFHICPSVEKALQEYR